jgi:flagellar basal body P-ring formation protein FlgA
MLAALILAAATTAPIGAAPDPVADALPAAITAAVQARVGHVDVVVDEVRVRGAIAAAGAVRAVPDAGSRLGGPIRFLLVTATAGDPRTATRVGSVDAVVRLRARFARATRALAPGTILAAGDVTMVEGDPGRVPLLPLPAADALVGTRLRRAIAEGAPVPGDAVTVPPLVRSGEEVATVVRVGAVTAQGRATALEDGALGAVVRVLVDKRRLRGRVSGAGEVEITP